jgi:hypothetical protein
MILGFSRSFRIRTLILSVFFFSFLGCFDYSEIITFKKGLSGTVEVSYEVPLKDDKETSLIRFLPTKLENIQERFEQNLKSASLQVKDYQFRVLSRGEYDEPFFEHKGKVSYRVDFNDISELERLLPGNMITKLKGKTLTVRREFPSLTDEYVESASVGEKKILSEITKILKDGSMQFKVVFPASTECISNKGTVGLGNLTYIYPLTDSLESSNGKFWEFKLRFYNSL